MNKDYSTSLEKEFNAHNLSLKDEAGSVAIIESALFLEKDMSEWASDPNGSFPKLNFSHSQEPETFKKRRDKLSKWPTSLRKSIILHCTENDKLPLEDKFSTLRLSSTAQAELKQIGAIYTPSWLADYITSTSHQFWGQLHRTGRKPQSIADISCGPGVFLSSARKLYGNSPTLHGRDIDKTSLDYAQLLSLVKNIDVDLETKDALLDSNGPLFDSDKKFDVIIGNPPYVRGSSLKESYVKEILRKYPDVVSGNFDLVVPFIRQTIDMLAPGGIASYIVSSKFMHSRYGKNICNLLANDVRLINIVDFKDSQLFNGYTTYTSIITFAKLKPVDKLSVTYFPEPLNNKEGLRTAKKFTLAREHLNNFPWNLSTTENQEVMRKLFDAKNPIITDIFTSILQGIRTGTNEIFIVEKEYSKANKLESKYLHPYVNGECIKKGVLNEDKYQLIYPYYLTDNGMLLINEEDFLNEAPNIFKYLHSKIKKQQSENNNKEWYGYSRPQNLTLPLKKKILVKEMMPQAEFAADTKGRFAITSGYAIVTDHLDEEEILMWSWVMNTPVMEFMFRQVGTQLHSGWFRLMKNHLEKIRLPNLTDNERKKVKKIIDDLNDDPDKLLYKLNKIIIQSFGLTKDEVAYIDTFLQSVHKRSLSGRQKNKEKSNNKNKNEDFYYPVKLKKYEKYHTQDHSFRQLVTFQKNKNIPIHNWYSFTQGFSDGLIENLISRMGVKPDDIVLDPFSGSGTTLLSCATRGVGAVGVEISPFLAWVTDAKLSALKIKDPEKLIKLTDKIDLQKNKQRSPELSLVFDDYLAKAFSENILNQIINLNEQISSLGATKKETDILRLALISILEDVSQVRKHGSHYRFMLNENSIGLQKLNTKIINPDSNIFPIYKNKVAEMVEDILETQKPLGKKLPTTSVINTDIRSELSLRVKPNHVITSPPYLNRNNYIAQQKTELALLSFVSSREEYKDLVKRTFRSHTDSDLNIDKREKIDREVQKIVDNITLSENNNPKIPEMVIGYFLDIRKTLENLHGYLPKGAKVAFVVGNSRWGGVVVPVDHLLMNMAEKIGFRPEEIIITRLKGNSPQQMRKYGKIPVRESIVIFKKV